MADNYRFYEVNGKRYKISEAESAEFEKDFPSAKVNMSANGKKYLVGIGERDEFVKDFGGNASYAYFDDDKVHWWESLVKPVGSAVVGTAQGFVDAFQALSPKLQEMAISRIQPYGVESVQTADMLPSYDEQRQDDNNPLTRASKRLSGIAERLSEEGDPEPDKGFIDLIFEGKIGKALQKGLATTGESSVTTLAARNPILAAVNMISLAGREFSRLSDEDSSIPVEKRAAMAIGGAAWEQTVEKMADPVFKYLGGGKVASEITEEMAKEALEKAAKESTENIAKRIFKKIKNIGKNVAKDAGGEGLEEIITSAGTDVLGQTLDWIDGNSDYGFTAQWEELKEQDPDADMWDFALAKAKEYGDAFIGGALSGGYMAGSTQAIAETAKASNEYRARKKVQESHDLGTQMGYVNMYDSDDLVREAGARVAESFVNEAGEQTISNEFIESLSSDEAFALSRNEEFSGRQRAELDALANAKAVQEGLNAKLDERLESRIVTAQNNIMIAAENGDITGGIVNGRAVYVKGGVVKNGVVYIDAVDFDGQQMHGPVLVIDANTGEKSYVNSDEISSVYTRDAKAHMADIERALTEKEARDRETARNTIGPIARLKAVQQLAGRKVQIDLGEGIIEVEIQNVSTKTGDVEIKGKKGDLGGQSIIKMPAHQFYNTIVRDDDGNPKFADSGQTTDEPINEPNETEDFRDFVGNILINGVPTEVEVTSQDDSSDSIVYEYVDENGIRRRGNSTIGEFIASVREAESYPPAIEEPMPEPIEEPIEQPVEQPVAPEQAAPQSINWDEMFEQDPEAYFSELQNKYGDRTEKMLNAVISATQKKLDALNKANPDTDEEIFANEEKKDKLQAKIDILQEMVARLSAAPSPTTKVPVAPDTTAESGQDTAPVDPNVPDFSSDRASDARARGYRVTSGQRVDRRGETAGTYGNDIEIAFTADSKGKRSGKVKVIDAGSLIPSHIGGVENVEHFLPEAQPKKRTDKASTVSASLIAQNMNNPQMTMVASSAYEGAPIVNRRGEVIQGNNRSAAILEMYQSHAAKASEYKQYLIDHASEYGLNADEVAAMQNPVLVRELDVDDSDAINLGQYTMQDMESGGNQSIDSGRAIAGLNNKGMMDYFVETLLAEENDESSDMNVSDLITRNGNAALKLLYAQGIINQTQYQSALGPDGRVNADTRAALRGIIEQQLFAGGIDNLGVMFEVLPDKAKKGIMQTIAKDVRGSEKERVTPYIQQSIEVFYNLNQQKDFASAKDDAEISAAIEAYKHQTSFDEPLTPAEKYSNFAFELARLFKTGTQKEIRAKFNALYDAMSGAADLFAGESEGKSLAEAVQEVYGVTLNTGNYETNGQSGTDILDNGDGGSAEGGQGSNGDLGVRPEVGEGGQRTSDGGTDTPVVGGTTGQAAGEVAPIAPNQVSNPIDEARKKERQLALNLKKIGLSPEAKQDLAYNAGKAIADMFATREEYDSYAETATDFGSYNSDFERGVDESFANRQNAGNSPVNFVPLESEPKGENNGEQQPVPNGDTAEGRSDNSGSGGNDAGSAPASEGDAPKQSARTRKSQGSKAKKQIDKYPARKGNATQKLLVDTFGLESVTIPNSRKEILNTIYDFMMEMSKTLGISPKSIGQGGWLGIGNLRANVKSIAEHQLRYNTLTGEVVNVSLRFKYARLSSIAHEWWHSLDRALGYFETGKTEAATSEIKSSRFSGRKEAWDAVNEVVKAIDKSGYTDRIKDLVKNLSRSTRQYFLSNTEKVARAFDQYITDRFAAAGITIENYDNHGDKTQPTAEEMKFIAPALDNLFKVLQEKEGKTAGTSILYHIGEMMDEDSDAKRFATEAILQSLKEAGIDVTKVTDEQVRQMLAVREELYSVEWMTVYHGSPYKFESFDHSHMGEGEGAQAHGWGTYVAKSTDTAKAYARMGRVKYTGPKLNYGSYEYEVAEDIAAIMNHGNSFEEAIKIGRRYWNNLQWEPSHRAKRAFLETLTPEDFMLRNLYDVEIPEDNRENYFYESNPTKKQVEKLYDACQKEGLEYAEVIAGETLLDNRPAGKKITSNLAKMLGSTQAASEFLSRAGFVGIKYDGRRDGECFVIFNESDAKITGRTEFYQTPNGTVYGWTDGKKIYLTKAGINPNTPIHEYTHLWAKAMMLGNPKGWNSVKQLLKGTPVWNEVMNDANYSNIHGNEDLVASEALSRISGSENAAKMEQMAQQMIDEAKGTGRKLEARGLIQNMRDALNKFWSWVETNLFGIENFKSVEQVTDRVLFDLLNKTDLGELSEGQVETQIVTNPEVIAELEASPKRTGYRNVVQNEDGTFSSPMAYWLQSKKGGAKTRVETAKFELGKWEEAEEHPELVDEKGHVVLVKPNKNTVEVAYDPYIHNRLDPVNLQFKDAWKRDELVYVETEVPETDLESGYHADEALLSVGVHSWSNGALMLSKYDKPVRIMPWEDVADAWVERLNGEGVEFDVVPPALRSLLVERGVEILPPHKGMGKDCNDAYKEWKNSEPKNNLVSLPKVSEAIESGVWDAGALNELNKIAEDVEQGLAILKRYTPQEHRGLLEGGRLLVGASILSRGSETDIRSPKRGYEGLREKANRIIPIITEWAKSNGVWHEYSERSDEEISRDYLDSGTEAQVFNLGNGKVEKIIGLDYYVDPQLALDRIAIHNALFPETNLEVVGFGTNKRGEFAIIVHQQTIAAFPTEQEKINAYIKSLGFELIDDSTHTFSNDELYLSDLHQNNVLSNDDKKYYIIDGDFRLNTPEAGIGGTRAIDDSIVRNDTDGLLFRSSDYPITPEIDAEYLAAVERGDMEAAQRMVDEAAKAAGYTIRGEHGRVSKFTIFDRDKANPEGNWGQGFYFSNNEDDVEENYATVDGPDLEAKIEREVEKRVGIAEMNEEFNEDGEVDEFAIRKEVEKEFITSEPNIVHAAIKMDKPFVVGHGVVVSDEAGNTSYDMQETYLDVEYEYDEDGEIDYDSEPTGTLIDLIDALNEEISNYDWANFNANEILQDAYDGMTASQFEIAARELLNSHIDELVNDRGDVMTSEILRAAIERAGFDGIIDNTVNQKFGTQRRYGQSMAGMDSDTRHYISFDSSNIKDTDPVTYDDAGNVIPLSERFNPKKKDIRYRKSDIQNAAVDYLAGPQRNEVIQRAVNEEAAKLGVNVTYATREEMPKGHKGDKGYYNTKTGEIVICTENAASIADAIQTILHEAVAHKGLRQLMGDKFNEFINRAYDSLDAETKAKVDGLAEKSYNGNKAVAMEEYMASLAETENFAKNSVWDKIKSAFEKVINAILGRNDIKIGDNELRYILRASYNNMVNPRNMDTIRGWAQDQMMREEYKINQSEPDILSRTGIDPTEVATQTASLVYDQVVSDSWQEFQRQFQDEMQPVRIAIDAIQQETGNIPVEDYENYLLIQNQSSSRSRVEIDIFQRRYYSPIIKQVNKIIDTILKSRGYDKKDRVKRSEVYKEVINYLIAKHGLERNAYYQATKTKMVDGIEVPDLRDYSGLTALFGMDPKEYEAAEAEAQKLVDNFERDYFAEAEVLWERINKATDKTLRHSYESGLISRQQYNDIKSMFEFYIPLRGFDESTAEDVYSYARFEGNRFNPAVQKAGGRTSLADDPIAIIMNMAESEIAQGNKNRAKQALYNFILNRPVTDSAGNQKQNSLMQIESVWYVQNVDAEGNVTYVMAAPNREIGETYEEFENRMNALAQEEGEEKGTTKAYKSKSGKVNVGMRFQKPTNANAHYIYLKINGVEKAIYVNGNPKAADAVNGANKKTISELSQKMRDVNRLVSSTFTNYSLEFTARNYFRDMIYSHINIGVKESDPAYRKKFRQNWRHNNLRSMITMLTAYRNGDLDGRPLTPEEAAFVEFMDNGGQTGYTLINSVENHKKDLERAIENMRNGLEKGGVKDSTAFKCTLGAIELLNEASELVTRFAAFKTSRDMGRSVVESINDAKEVTVNFNTRGAQDGKGWMGAIAHYLGWSKYFFNASVQGVQNIKAMAKANTLKFCSTVGGVMASGFLVPIITSVIAEMFGGDEEEYWNIPEYDRQNNLCIVVGGGKYVKIPLPIGFREIYALGDMIAAMSFDQKFQRDTWQIGTDMANKIASVVLPINPLESSVNGLSIWHTFAYTLAPSSAQFIIQNLSNVDWKGAPLQKEYTYNENDPQWMKAFASNPDWMVGVTKWINKLTSADDMKGVDLSPEKFDNFLSNMFGGIYTVIKKTGRTMSMIWNEENRNLSNIPLAGVIIGSNIDMDDRFVQDAYYDMKDYYDDRIGWIKTRADKFGYELENILIDMDGGYQPKIAEIYDNKNFEWMQAWYKGNKILEAKKKAIKDYEKELALYEEPTQEQIEHKTRLTDEFLNYRREFVDEMLEMN